MLLLVHRITIIRTQMFGYKMERGEKEKKLILLWSVTLNFPPLCAISKIPPRCVALILQFALFIVLLSISPTFHFESSIKTSLI
jgi:hypothetical protein